MTISIQRLFTLRTAIVAMFVLILLFTAVLAILLYTRFFPIDVLKDWKLSIPDQKYQSGQTVTFVSSATKLRAVEGDATRFLRCDATSTAKAVEVEINSERVNRPVGQRPPSENQIVIPDVPNTPRRCKLYISIKYDVFPNLREPFYEYESTGYFTVAGGRS